MNWQADSIRSKPNSDYDTVGHAVSRYVPHGTTQNNVRGLISKGKPGTPSERIKPNRLGMMSSRSKCNTASAGPKAQRFVKVNVQVDHAIDHPVQTTLTPRVWNPPKRVRSI